MKKVQCPACGATGVVFGRINNSRSLGRPPSRCDKCEGFGFIMMDVTEFSKRRSDFRKYGRNPRFLALGECCEFTKLAKVRNLRNRNVWVPTRGWVPYSIFYKEHRNPRY